MSPPFCHELTKITQTKSNKGQEEIDNQGNTKQFNSIENRVNSPYEEQRLRTSFSPYKYTKNKSSFGKNSFGETVGGGKIKTHKPNLKTKLRIHMKKNILFFNKCKLDTM